MQHTASSTTRMMATVFPDLAPAEPARQQVFRRSAPAQKGLILPPQQGRGSIHVSVLSFQNMHHYGDLLPQFLRARKHTFIDKLHWDLPSTDGMEFDQYDTPQCRWVILHEFGEILGGVRMMPTTARCGVYSYMLRDAQLGLLEPIPTDVLFFEAPVSRTIWEATRLFISDSVPGARRSQIQALIMESMAKVALRAGAAQVIGIVPAIWTRFSRKMDVGAVPVGPRFSIDGTVSQAALFNTVRVASVA